MLNQYPSIIYEPQWMIVSIETIKDKKGLSLYSKIYPVYPLDTETAKIDKMKYPYVHFMIHDETQCFGRQEIGNMDKNELGVLNLILMHCDLQTFGGYSMYSNKALKLLDQYRLKFCKTCTGNIKKPRLRRESTTSYNTTKTQKQTKNEHLLTLISKGNITVHSNKYI